MDDVTEQAKRAIDKVFGDYSVPKETTAERLRELAEHIEYLQDALE